MDRLLAHNCPLIGGKVWLLERLEPLTTLVGVAYYILTQSFFLSLPDAANLLTQFLVL